MSENSAALFFAVSGMRGTGRTKLFKELKSVLPIKFRGHKFAFFDDPFGGLSHPLLWAAEERELHPVSRLFKLWTPLNEFNVKKLRPELRVKDVVVVDGYGLNALLYATAYVGDKKHADNEAVEMHHPIVGARVIKQKIPVPEYFVTMNGEQEQIRYLQETIRDISVPECAEFIRKEEKIIRDYFHPDTGQKGNFFDASRPTDEMVEQIESIIGHRFAERDRWAAYGPPKNNHCSVIVRAKGYSYKI